MKNSNLNYSTLINTHFVKTVLQDSSMEGADLSGSLIREANFVNSNINNANFEHSNVPYTNFTGCSAKKAIFRYVYELDSAIYTHELDDAIFD